MLLRILALCVLLASAETLHGIFRTVWLVRRVGKARAQQIGIVTGSLLALAICWWQVPGIGLSTPASLLALGLGLALFMAAFDLVLGLTLMRRSLAKAFQDFNPASGNYLVFGLAVLCLAPLAVGWARGLIQ